MEKPELSIQINKSEEDAADAVKEIFTNEGYSIENGDKFSGEYGKGSKLMRILFGGFYPRFVFNVEIEESASGIVLNVKKHGVSKISGGALGNHKINKELNKLSEILKEKFVSQE